MCSNVGDCFIVLPPNCAESLIFGRNAQDAAALAKAQAIHYYESAAATDGQSDGGATPDLPAGDQLRIILQKPLPGVWGGDCGANERNVCMGITWTAETESGNGDQLNATDIVRYTLAVATSVDEAVERIGALTAVHAGDACKWSFIVCDPTAAWAVSCGGKLWAAQQLNASGAGGYLRLPSDGLAVTSTIDKSSTQLADALKTLGRWNGEGDINFAACFDATPTAPAWCGAEPTGDGGYTLTSMFTTLRAAAQADRSRSATVSVLVTGGISCHWFTGTPNASESVFKPFVFAPQPRISPLTQAGDELTLLHKLHAQRKPAAVEDLKALEASCVEEVNRYLAEHPSGADEELDELMKDCVEAEVKFYR